MLLINAVEAPDGGTHDHLVLQLFTPGIQAPYEFCLTPEAVLDAVRCVLRGVAALPPDVVAFDPLARAERIPLEGQVQIAFGRMSESGALLQISLRGIEMVFPVSREGLIRLRAQIGATLQRA